MVSNSFPKYLKQEFTNTEDISKSIKSNIMHKTLQYGESWELATLKLATLLVENAATRSQLVLRLTTYEYMPKNNYFGSIRPEVTNKTRKYAENS